MTSVVVTGINGFIGTFLSSRLQENGYTVIGVTRRDGFPQREGTVVCDLAEATPDISRADVVVHLAAYTPVRKSFSPTALTEYMKNVSMAASAIRLAERTKAKFIYASTAEIYAYTTEEYYYDEVEGGLSTPSSPYGISKLAAEYYVRYYAETNNIPTVILRPTNTFGRVLLPHKDADASGYFVEKVLTGVQNRVGEIHFTGMGESRRQWLFVDDLVGAYMKAVEYSPDERVSVFNIANDGSASTSEIVRYVKSRTYDFTDVWMTDPRPGDAPFLLLDNYYAKEFLKWYPKHTVWDGLDICLKGVYGE